MTSGPGDRRRGSRVRSPDASRPTGTRCPVILVRLLLFLALAAIAVVGGDVPLHQGPPLPALHLAGVKFTIVILAVVLIFFAFERLVGPML